MKPYQKPPLEAAVLPATEMMNPPRFPNARPPPGSMLGPRPMGAGLGGVPPHQFNQFKGRPGTHGINPPPAYPIPAPRSSSGLTPQSGMTPTGPKLPKPQARYYPSLSGSETDVSTSTENLTQVGFFFHAKDSVRFAFFPRLKQGLIFACSPCLYVKQEFASQIYFPLH